MLKIKYSYSERGSDSWFDEVSVSEEELIGLVRILSLRNVNGISEVISEGQEEEISDMSNYIESLENQLESANDQIIELLEDQSLTQETNRSKL